jgi:N-acetylglucosaminyldiphosphoundecaprenol N-acetyl-beta-D-mannosaminyltransferase
VRNNLRIAARHYPFPENLASAARILVEAVATLRTEPLLCAVHAGADGLERADALATRSGAGEAALVITLNLDHLRLVRRDPAFREACDGAALVVADGAPVVWAAALAGRRPRPSRLTGSDLLHGLAARGRSLFFLGGGPGVAERAAEALRARYPAARIAGTYAGPPRGALEDPAEVDRMIGAVAEARPEVVLASFGSPRQEVFLWRNRARLAAGGARLLAGIGAALDFAAGSAPRAPAWMRRAGLEWLFRLAREPRRLAPRYAADAAFFPRLLAESLCARLIS